MKLLMSRMWDLVWSSNETNIKKLLEVDPKSVYLDLGCDDGERTIERAQRIGTQNTHGVDIIDQKIEISSSKGIQAKKCSLNESLPYRDNIFDVITANQVIEHLVNTDMFISEIFRILKKGGYAVISTENASSWHNIFSLILGYQMFSLTNISNKMLGIGNPFSLHRGEGLDLDSWQHVRIFSYKGLVEVFEVHGFKVESVLGAGYLPFWNRLAMFDKRHASVLTIKARKR